MRYGVVLAGLLLVSWSFVQPASAAEAVKFGFVDAQKVLDKTKAGQRSKEAMEEYVKSRQKIIDLDEVEIKRLQEDLGRQASVLSEEARRVKEESLQKKFAEYQKRVADLNKEVQGKKKEILEEFNRGLEGIAKTIAKKKGYTVVLDRGSEGSVVVYASDEFDMTDEIIKEYDKIAP